MKSNQWRSPKHQTTNTGCSEWHFLFSMCNKRHKVLVLVPLFEMSTDALLCYSSSTAGRRTRRTKMKMCGDVLEDGVCETAAEVQSHSTTRTSRIVFYQDQLRRPQNTDWRTSFPHEQNTLQQHSSCQTAVNCSCTDVTGFISMDMMYICVSNQFKASLLFSAHQRSDTLSTTKAHFPTFKCLLQWHTTIYAHWCQMIHMRIENLSLQS